MFRPLVAIIRFYHSTHLFYTIHMAACLMRRSLLEHSISILGVWVNHVIIHKDITLYYQKPKQKQET